MVQLPDHGLKMARYDLADRLTEQVQADGSRTEYRYDAAGRLILKAARPAPAAGGKAGPWSATMLRYQGARLVEVRDPAQLTEYAFDDAGRIAATTVSLLGTDGRPVARYATAARYDMRTGEPSSQTLADGRVLEIGRDPATQAARSVTLRGALASRLHGLVAALPGWMQGLQRMIPSTDVATGIRFHPFDGIGGYRQGNGVETAKRFDSAGRLTRIEVGTAQAQVFGARYDYGVGRRSVQRMSGPTAAACSTASIATAASARSKRRRPPRHRCCCGPARPAPRCCRRRRPRRRPASTGSAVPSTMVAIATATPSTANSRRSAMPAAGCWRATATTASASAPARPSTSAARPSRSTSCGCRASWWPRSTAKAASPASTSISARPAAPAAPCRSPSSKAPPTRTTPPAPSASCSSMSTSATRR
ncbi:RHS repeat domain-containing protein [Chitinimonas koreensis]|uniref:RHS repeat domain-containing protein n=1 Tax=Chitinimonas koreensis TaxID=356302 RepID=UPI00223F4BA3|nr:RHS repeat domain-containing protein [Chitinimonas koreensis]